MPARAQRLHARGHHRRHADRRGKDRHRLRADGGALCGTADAVIDAYVNGGKAFGKAGAYGIQDEELAGYITYEGDYYNVVGLRWLLRLYL